jgi:large subunit ribosomal protein L13
MLTRKPERVVELAVRGMLPDNRLGDAMYRKLKVYSGPAHPHEAQKPVAFNEAPGITLWNGDSQTR